ncbi:MAG: hypothetical protein VXW22_15385 [Pseudomonadota bacterium]|nr:hypothetical protein [Pseudomonadota bacterium]
MQLVLIIALFVWPPMIGIVVAFQRQPDRWSLAGVALAMVPLLGAMLTAAMMSDRSVFNLSDLSILLIMTLIAGLFYFLARRLAKPFSEQWREYRDERVEETFK